jgi:hypothetical protein
MRLLVRLAQALDRDVGVDLCGRQARVAEDLLNRTQVGPTLEDVSSGGMAPSVGPYVGGALYGSCGPMHDRAHGARVDAPTPRP